MDNNVLIFIPKAASGKFDSALIHQMKAIECFAQHIDVLTTTKTKKSYEIIKQESLLNNLGYCDGNDLLNFYHEDIIKNKKFNNWNDIIDNINIDFLKNYDRIYIFSGLFSSVNKRYIKNSDKFPFKYGWKFQSNAIKYIFILAIIKAHKTFNIPIFELMFDPHEVSLDLLSDESVKINKSLYDLRFGYNIPEYNVKKIDFMQYYYSKKQNNKLLFNEKQYDMIFGYVFVNKDRLSVIENFYKSEKLFDIKFKNFKIFRKDTIDKNIDTSIKRSEYLEYISKSKYTLIIPSYDKTQVSILRILESIHNNCIPLFTPDNNFDILLKSFPDFNYKDYILDENFKQFSEDEWSDKLNHCKNIFMQIKDFSIKGL